MTSRIARVALMMMVTATLTAVPAAATTPDDPFPAGACIRVTLVDPKPICVIVDPTA